MKYLKLFENYIKIKDGNYVLMHTIHEPTKDFINNNIGKIVDVEYGTPGNRKGIIVDYIKVKFNKIPWQLNSYFTHWGGKYCVREYPVTSIVEIGKTKKEVEEKMLARKYNIL